jgi:hypothetical protein
MGITLGLADRDDACLSDAASLAVTGVCVHVGH